LFTGAKAERQGFAFSRSTLALAASVTLAAGFGAIVGALAMTHYNTPAPPKIDTAALEERGALQKSVAHLSKELASLKTSVDNAHKSSIAQIGKIAERVERIERAPETTGSIAKAAPTPAPAPAGAPVAVTPPPMPTPRPQIVQGWSVQESRDGYLLVEN